MLYDLGLSLFGTFIILAGNHLFLSLTQILLCSSRYFSGFACWSYICLLWFILTFNYCLTSSGFCVVSFNNLFLVGNDVLVLLPNNMYTGDPPASLQGKFRRFNNARYILDLSSRPFLMSCLAVCTARSANPLL